MTVVAGNLTRPVKVRLASGFVGTWVIALSSHMVPLQAGIPFPSFADIPYFASFGINTLSAVGIIVLVRMFPASLIRSPLKSWAVSSLLCAMLTENLFRGAFMNGYCTSAITYSLAGNVPYILTLSAQCALAVACAPKVRQPWKKFGAGIVIAGTGMIIAKPVLTYVFLPLLQAIAPAGPNAEWCALPYGPAVLIPAYLTFVEPTLACMIIASLLWDRLPKSHFKRCVTFTLIVMAIKKQLITAIVYALFRPHAFVASLISMGQFTLEAFALAVLTIATLEWAGQWQSLLR